MYNHISLFLFHQAIKWFLCSFVLIFLLSPFFTLFLLGTEVDEPFKFLIKTSNTSEYIESNLQNIEALTHQIDVVVNCKPIRGKIKSKLTNLMKITRIEGYNGKYGSNPHGIIEISDDLFEFDQIGQ